MFEQIRGGLIVFALLAVFGVLYLDAPKPPPAAASAPPAAPEFTVAHRIDGVVPGNGPNLAWPSEDFAVRSRWRAERIAVSRETGQAPQGAQDAWRLTATADEGVHRIETDASGLTPGGVYTLSVYVRPEEIRELRFEVRDAVMVRYGLADFIITQSTLLKKSGDIVAAGIERLPNGWYRCWAAMPFATDHAVFSFGLVAADGGVSFAGRDKPGLLVWGAQLSPGSQPIGYAATRDGPVPKPPPAPPRAPSAWGEATVARPVRGVVPGNGPNLAWPSEDFAAPSRWRVERLVLARAAGQAPQGTKDAWRLTAATEEGVHRIESDANGLTPGGVYTLSVYVRPEEIRLLRFEMRDGVMGRYGLADFTVAQTTLLKKSGDIVAAGIERLPNGWYRCWAAMPFATDHAVFNFALLTAEGRASFPGTDKPGLLVWGAQFSPGAQAIGYATTQGGPVAESTN